MDFDLEPQDPKLGPPLPKALHVLWPKDMQGPPGSMAYRAQSYASGIYRTGKATPEQAIKRARRWMSSLLR